MRKLIHLLERVQLYSPKHVSVISTLLNTSVARTTRILSLVHATIRTGKPEGEYSVLIVKPRDDVGTKIFYGDGLPTKSKIDWDFWMGDGLNAAVEQLKSSWNPQQLKNEIESPPSGWEVGDADTWVHKKGNGFVDWKSGQAYINRYTSPGQWTEANWEAFDSLYEYFDLGL